MRIQQVFRVVDSGGRRLDENGIIYEMPLTQSSLNFKHRQPKPPPPMPPPPPHPFARQPSTRTRHGVGDHSFSCCLLFVILPDWPLGGVAWRAVSEAGLIAASDAGSLEETPRLLEHATHFSGTSLTSTCPHELDPPHYLADGTQRIAASGRRW